MKKLTGKGNFRSSLPEYFNVNGVKVTTTMDIADNFCTYYTNVGAQLASNIIPTAKSFDHYLRNSPIHSIFFTPTIPHEVVNMMNRLKSKRSSGCDNLSMKLLKDLK